MKMLFLIITGLTVNLLYCQENTYRFDYSISLNKYSETDYRWREFMNKAEYSSGFATFSLFINNEGMKFESIRGPISDEDYLGILDLSTIDGIYYRKNNSDLFFREPTNTFFGKDNIITKKIITDWQITEEEKIINGYKCFKATCIMKEDFGDGDINPLYPVTAWFCPDIKYQYGPKGIGGLPGLILELELKLVTFKISNIEPNPMNIAIAIPENKNIITEDELHILIREHAKKATKN